MDTNGEQAKTVYSELDLAGGSATYLGFGIDSEAGRGTGSFEGKKREVPAVPRWGGSGWPLEAGYTRTPVTGYRCVFDFLPRWSYMLDVGVKVGKAVNS